MSLSSGFDLRGVGTRLAVKYRDMQKLTDAHAEERKLLPEYGQRAF